MVKTKAEKPATAELALRPEQTLQQGELIPSMEAFDLIKSQAAQLIKTGFLPRHLDTPEKATAVVLIGREMGIPMMQALRKVYVIQGTPALASELMLALCNRTGQVQDFTHKDDGNTCTVTLTRKGRTPYVATFSMADAKAMGLEGKDNWKKQPGVMRYNRAMSKACRAVFPDATMGMYTLDEIAPEVRVDTTGSPVGGELPLDVQPIKQAQEKEPEVTSGEEMIEGEAREVNPEARISDADRKAVWAAAKSRGISPDAFKTYLKAHFNYTSGGEIQEKNLDAIRLWVSEQGKGAQA